MSTRHDFRPFPGRCLDVKPVVLAGRTLQAVTVASDLETRTFDCARVDGRPGDWVEIRSEGGAASPTLAAVRLTPWRARRPFEETGSQWRSRISSSRRRHALSVRSRVEAGIREFLSARGYLETRTPLLVPCPGMEPHIRPFRLETGAYLPTSPEFAMKRLLVGGLERIFQLCPSFRLEPGSRTHHPEFTMLEFYRAFARDEDLMREVEELFAHVARAVLGCEPGSEKLTFEGREISVATPWPRLRVRDLFRDLAGIDLVACPTAADLRPHCERLGTGWAAEDTWDDLYFRIWLNIIEPRLPADRAVFVTRYPASQAALSVVDADEDGSRWARRFELYAGGLELGNAFEELTDPVEQRRRFVEDMELRRRQYGDAFPPNPIDEEFLESLEEGMPPASGIAIGVDRMVMLFADEADIDQTIWLPSYSGVASD